MPTKVAIPDSQEDEIVAKAAKPKHDHYGHRNRLKKRFLEQGIDGMEDHEVLEALLYFGIPYKNTNDTAYEILKRYGSLANALEADFLDLQQVQGVGPHSAFLMTFIPQLARRYFTDRWQDKQILANTRDIYEYAKALFVGRSQETFFMICLNSRNQVNHVLKIGEGNTGEVVVFPSQVVELALRHKCRRVIFAHNHPGGNLKASASDIDLTKVLMQALHPIGVSVLDHMIIAGNRYFSFLESNYLATVRSGVERALAQEEVQNQKISSKAINK